VVVAVLAGVSATAGCGSGDASRPAAAAPVIGPPTDGSAVVRCLGELPGGATAAVLPDLPPGARSAVRVDIPRPDLPKGSNRVTAVAFADGARAAEFARGGGAFVSGTGGAAEVVGPWVVTSTFGGDAGILATLKRCVAG
jgi:hypothetical protein